MMTHVPNCGDFRLLNLGTVCGDGPTQLQLGTGDCNRDKAHFASDSDFRYKTALIN